MPEAYAEVIGDPIGHSLSPVIHRRWIAALGLQASYEATHVQSDDLARFFTKRGHDQAWRGCNVTAPHKRVVTELVDRLTPAAELIGAVNCIYRDGEALVGDNTDIAGIAVALAGVDLTGGRAVILGAGGAAAPAVDHLLRYGVGEIVLLTRDPAKAASLRQRASDRIAVASFEADAIAGASLVINATPLGMTGGAEMPQPILDALTSAERDATVLDMVYRPARTRLLAAAEAAGLRAVGGIEMLIGQARPAFERFFGQAAPTGDDEALRRTLA